MTFDDELSQPVKEDTVTLVVQQDGVARNAGTVKKINKRNTPRQIWAPRTPPKARETTEGALPSVMVAEPLVLPPPSQPIRVELAYPRAAIVKPKSGLLYGAVAAVITAVVLALVPLAVSLFNAFFAVHR
jgi:hypothetical protein